MDAEREDRRETADASESDGDAPPAGAAADCIAAGSGSTERQDSGKAQPFDGLGSRISALKKEQAELLTQQKQHMKDFPNAKRGRRRFIQKARNLSMDDLQQFVDMRGPGEMEETAVGAAPSVSPKKKQKKFQEGRSVS